MLHGHLNSFRFYNKAVALSFKLEENLHWPPPQKRSTFIRPNPSFLLSATVLWHLSCLDYVVLQNPHYQFSCHLEAKVQGSHL